MRSSARSETAGASPLRLISLGIVAKHQADYASASVYLEESLAIEQEIKDWRGIATTLSNLGTVAHSQGDYPGATVYHENSLAIEKQIGARSGIANSSGNLGAAAYYMADYNAARSYFDECLSIKREIGDPIGIAATPEQPGRRGLHSRRLCRHEVLLPRKCVNQAKHK